ncbi:Ig-like domain-containing protein [Lysinibacillus capsici]|uniref:Ig-like domain-containing protein n=1 Tax=Lysinibacillus capsici TaxID=2115968 RepID=UPI0028BDC2B6|nr:Ig-like domain-containing protein [Lysinibacillus capsici]WNN74313.1 Ig-like domain-containing protein [Lysinibacillus capsici]
MVKYYYDKFTAIENKQYNDDAPWTNSSATIGPFSSYAKSYSFDRVNNKYILGPTWGYDGGPVNIGSIVYSLSGNFLSRHSAKEATYDPTVTVPVNTVYKDATKNTSTIIDYSKGSLVQSNISAEDGTFPADGRHTDGYWYVKGVVVNTAPITPRPFTQPSGNLEIGDSKVFSVGAASDAEGNLSKYIWEASLNGGAYSKVGETTTNNLTYTIPTATSLKMRVKAVDSAGLESAFRESSLYTVQPPQYYYSKYTIVETTTYSEPPFSWKGDDYSVAFSGLYRSYYWNSQNRTFGLSGGQHGPNVELPAGTEGYTLFGSEIYRYRSQKAQNSTYSVDSSASAANATNAVGNTTYSRGSLVQSNITGGYSTYPANGRHTDGYWYVRGSRVSDTIAPPTPFTSPTTGKKFKPSEAATIAFGASNAANLSLYEVDFRYNTTGAWTPLPYNNTLSRSLTITTDKTFKTLELRVRAKNTSNVYSDYVYSEPFEIEHNVAPTVSLTGPSDNSTLYENDTLTIAGTAYDADSDQSVTVYYQVNSEQRKVLATNLSKTQITLSKQLTFKGGKLFDGEVVLTDALAEGVPHTLKVWAVDNENSQSANIERTFYVVPNRAPLLSVDAIVPSGIINTDKFKISGTASDQDANSSVKVNYRINGANPIEIYDGAGGAWEFDVSLGQLQVGENLIVVEVIDNYNAKTSKTIKLNKNEVKTPILQSVARYKIEPPKGSAKGVLLFVERDEELDLQVELSMTLTGEQEEYVTLSPVNTAPTNNDTVEDTFEYTVPEEKQNIILKITQSRTDLTFNHKIHLISGAVD